MIEDNQEHKTKINDSTEISLSVTKTKPLSYTEDWEGDKSSKRLTAFILLYFSLSIALFAVIFEAIKGWQSYELIKYIFSFSLGGSLVSLGLTIPEIFSKK